jgi:hypothetical protein
LPFVFVPVVGPKVRCGRFSSKACGSAEFTGAKILCAPLPGKQALFPPLFFFANFDIIFQNKQWK